MTTWVTGSGIHHFAAQSKMASISEEFPGDCFDFDRLSASSLGGSVLNREQKQAVSRSREDFPFCGSISAPQCIFKRIARRILSIPANSEILNRFPVEMYLVFPPWSRTEILQLTPQTRHASELAVTRDFSSRINSTQLSKCIESISWATLTDLTGFFSREETVNWFDQWRLQISARPLEHETEWSCYSLPIFSAGRALHHPYPRAFCTLPSFARIKGSTSTSTIARNNRGLWTV